MPIYSYLCPSNNQKLDVMHGMNERAQTWGELCRFAKCDPGDTPEDTPVKRLITAPHTIVPTGNSDLKSHGFSKLVKREDGVYENVTATDNESRIVRPGDRSTYPDMKKKFGD
ncbi:zinc ribbon domain-containing protein [Oxynema aestuarii]|uniref:Zinc ribbon domain-containing protein n=1 Tax=Oxynema aestuarii AP17 TaxID=2064643 RepID=A0A6H1TRL0_9CYAN|nr:zinc ribbon domain-containing protein [Oxynema aestuarii]QIZ69238.1 zinc ribbon domain-containing protein [Oxynema aestuarii AP17]RMH78244.1 MAG: zinc ribbon domain-containing protein [Cyanobacteria bacterium J007]